MRAQDLYGAYSYKGGDALFEEMLLETDNNFYSWLDERPTSTYSWLLKNKTVYVKTNGALEVFEFKVISVNQKEAIFMFEYSDEKAMFSRSE